MGKISKHIPLEVNLTPIQRVIFDNFSKTPGLKKKFYLTGGTALSAFYLNHRESEDLDFFSKSNLDILELTSFAQKIAKAAKMKFILTELENTKIFELVDRKTVKIKFDFAYYPYRLLKKGLKIDGVTIDSKYDIGVNKLFTINQRKAVKDFVDLYFLLQEFTFWDLYYGVEAKFGMEVDLVFIAASMFEVSEFNTLPKMLVPLKLEELKSFYKDLAKKVGMRVTEK